MMTGLSKIKSQVAHVRQREEARLIRVAKKSGLFASKFTSQELETLFRNYAESKLPRKTSQLAKLEHKMKVVKKAQSEQERRDDARRKILLGSFIIAQMKHKPVLKAEMTPELVQFLELHKDPKAVKRNKALLNDWIGVAPVKAEGGDANGAELT